MRVGQESEKQSLAIVSVKTETGEKNITAFDLDFVSLASNAENNLENANRIEFNFEAFTWEYYPAYDLGPTTNPTEGLINGFTSSPEKYIKCTTDWQIILRVNVDEADHAVLEKLPTFTSDSGGENWDVKQG